MIATNGHQTVELATNTNGREPMPDKWTEVGSLGLQGYSGYIAEAYDARLFWPEVSGTYTKMWRADPEIGMARIIYSSLSGQQAVGVEIPERAGQRELGPPTDDDKRARDFVYEALDDVEGGIGNWFSSCMARTPFYGWGVWEAPFGLRRHSWKPPRPSSSQYDDPWRSQYDDGLVGYRRLAFRSYSSFFGWEADDYSGRVYGLKQSDYPNPQRTIPLDRCLHIRYGDLDNPEGLATMETIWRLEYIKRALETVLGMGLEKSAGYLSVEKTTDGATTDRDLGLIRDSARAVMSVQEGNYLAWPFGWKGGIIDTPFAAGPIALETIRYLGILKMATLGMQFIAMSTISGSGSYAALDDSSSVALLVYNSISQGIIKQADEQIIKRLFAANPAAFPGMTRRPRLTISNIDKKVSLVELGQFAQAMQMVMRLGDDDFLAIRAKSGILPEKLPEVVVEPVTAVPDVDGAVDSSEDEAEDEMDEGAGAEMAQIQIGEFCTLYGASDEVFIINEIDEAAGLVHLSTREGYPRGWNHMDRINRIQEAGTAVAGDGMEMAQKVVARFTQWAEENEPETAALLAREV